ncbi:MAG TPA: hypothetical protein VFA30_06520 [Gaiellaceae bacterium]|nr:hypothetical protein [Gaiellaceae bacterium]
MTETEVTATDVNAWPLPLSPSAALVVEVTADEVLVVCGAIWTVATEGTTGVAAVGGETGWVTIGGGPGEGEGGVGVGVTGTGIGTGCGPGVSLKRPWPRPLPWPWSGSVGSGAGVVGAGVVGAGVVVVGAVEASTRGSGAGAAAGAAGAGAAGAGTGAAGAGAGSAGMVGAGVAGAVGCGADCFATGAEGGVATRLPDAVASWAGFTAIRKTASGRLASWKGCCGAGLAAAARVTRRAPGTSGEATTTGAAAAL